jgi:tetratricopeptide (TPR) repeat protein
MSSQMSRRCSRRSLRLTDACKNTESAAAVIAGFWNDVCSALLESGKFDDVITHLEKLDDNARDRARAGLVRGWSRSNQLERAAEELKRIRDASSRATAMVFLARAEATAGRKEAAASLLTEATELVRGETNTFVKIEPLVLAVETLALWGDYAAAERDAKQLDATIPPDAWMYYLFGGPRSDYFEMPYQIPVGHQTSWLLIARAQLRAGKIDEALSTVERIIDASGGRYANIVERYRAYFFGLVARELLRTGKDDRVADLLSKEPSAVVREAIETELNAARKVGAKE